MCLVQQLQNKGDTELIPLSFGKCRQHCLSEADIFKDEKGKYWHLTRSVGVVDHNQGFEALEMESNALKCSPVNYEEFWRVVCI